ncbi:MAG: hypothetical protein ACJATW_002774, partial [Glaciecola sp.]
DIFERVSRGESITEPKIQSKESVELSLSWLPF